MLANDLFFSSLVFTLGTIGVLVALAGIVFAAIWIWRFSQPFREWLRRSWIIRFIRAAGTVLGVAMTYIKSFVMGLLLVFVVRPWRTFIALLVALGNLLRQVPWGISVGVLVVYSLPFIAFITIGMPLRAILGVVAAGVLIGMLCAPFTGWHCRRFGTSRAFGVSLLTIVGGAWGSSMLIATLVLMNSN